MNKLTRKQLAWYGISGIGPNMLNLMVGSYLCDALMTAGFSENIANWTYLGTTLVSVFLWSIIVTIAKIIDGVIDIPLGHLTDKLKTKWGNRRPSMLIGICATLLSYVMFLICPSQIEMVNTIWFGFWLCTFYASYTLLMVTYYATFSEVTINDEDRVFLSNTKSTVDIIYFCLGYALVPFLVSFANIRIIAAVSIILMASMIIPFVLLKERSTLPKDVELYRQTHPEDKDAVTEVEPSMWQALKHTLKNRDFIVWMIIYGALQFGLSMYLSGFNVYYSGAMGFEGMDIMICNIASFAPVPFTLILYNRFVNLKGFKFGFQYALLMFVIGMFMSIFCRTNLIPDRVTRIILAVVGNSICSLGIGSFFSVSYTIPSHLAVKEKEETGRSHPAMYFAVQGLFEACISAIAVGVVWVNLRNIAPVEGSLLLNPSGGSGLLNLIVCIACFVAFLFTFFLPKSLAKVGKRDKTEKK